MTGFAGACQGAGRLEGIGSRVSDARREEFAGLLTACWARLYRFAFHLTGNAVEAEELVQQAAVDAFAAFHTYRPGSAFDRWVMRILHNNFTDGRRRARRRRYLSLDALAQTPLAGPTADPETALTGWVDGPVRRALNALPPEFRAAVVLVDLEGYSYEEASAILGCPAGTLRSRLHRGRLALREWLRPYVDALRRGEG